MVLPEQDLMQHAMRPALCPKKMARWTQIRVQRHQLVIANPAGARARHVKSPHISSIGQVED